MISEKNSCFSSFEEEFLPPHSFHFLPAFTSLIRGTPTAEIRWLRFLSELEKPDLDPNDPYIGQMFLQLMAAVWVRVGAG